MQKLMVMGTIYRKDKKDNLTKLTVNVSRKKDGGWVNEYFDFVAFSKTKEFIDQWFHEGNPILVEAEQSSFKKEVDGVEKTLKSWVIRQTHFVAREHTKGKFNKDLKNQVNEKDNDDDDDGELPF